MSAKSTKTHQLQWRCADHSTPWAYHSRCEAREGESQAWWYDLRHSTRAIFHYRVVHQDSADALAPREQVVGSTCFLMKGGEH